MSLVYLSKLARQLPAMLARVQADGIATMAAALPLKLCDGLRDELDVSGYRDRAEVFTAAGGDVQQEFETLPLRYPMPGYPMVGELGQELGALVRAVGGEPFAAWQPNDVAAQLYQPHHIGITRHRDFMRDRLLVVVFSLCGIASFNSWSEQGQMHEPCLLTTGSLVLLRSPGLGKNPVDNRLYHAIGSPISKPRLSLAYRHNVSY